MQTELEIYESKSINFIESPETVHGRLMESVHMTGYTMARACKELEWLLDENRWQQIGKGFEHVNEFLKTIDLSEFKISIERRKSLATKLQKLQASQRATAKALGVSNVTIKNDLEDVKNLTSIESKTTSIKEEIEKDVNYLTQPPIPIIQTGSDAAKIIERAARKEEAATETKARREASRNASPIIDGLDLRIGDAREVLSDIEEDSVHLILTDPPYGDEAEPLYKWLAEWAMQVLIPGGSLICFTGQSRLDRDIRIFSEFLRYWWLLAIRHNQAQRLPGKFVMAEFKPVLWYVKDFRRGKTLVNDVLRSDRRDKEGHDWGQGDGGVELLIEQLTDPDDLIIDPFAGTGRWGQIANRMGRHWIGADIKIGGSTEIVV